jgi:hypothetical protein
MQSVNNKNPRMLMREFSRMLMRAAAELLVCSLPFCERAAVRPVRQLTVQTLKRLLLVRTRAQATTQLTRADPLCQGLQSTLRGTLWGKDITT